MQHVFKRKSESTTIVTVQANQPAGAFDDSEAPVRHTVHRTLAGVQVELRDNPPVLIQGDRQIELDVPVVPSATRTILLDIKNGVYGVPVVWSTSYIPGVGLDVVMVAVVSEPLPGETNFNVRMVLQPVT